MFRRLRLVSAALYMYIYICNENWPFLHVPLLGNLFIHILFFLIVANPTVSITPQNSSTVLQGTNVNFTCTADGLPKPTITWSKINESSFATTSVITNAEEESILILTNVTNDEEGTYECTAYNTGKSVKKQVRLVVHGKGCTIYQRHSAIFSNSIF